MRDLAVVKTLRDCCCRFRELPLRENEMENGAASTLTGTATQHWVGTSQNHIRLNL